MGITLIIQPQLKPKKEFNHTNLNTTTKNTHQRKRHCHYRYMKKTTSAVAQYRPCKI